jgi:hypothetical protein
MQTMKSLNAVLLVALLGVSLSACDFFEQRDRSYQGPPQLEFAPLTETVDEGDGAITTNVQLIGPQRDSALPVSYVVDDSSTAVEGTHFNLASTSVSIDAGESAADVEIDILDNDADDGDTNYVLYLSLQESDGVEPAANLRTFVLTIRGTDE